MSRCTSCGHDESAHFAMSLNGACCVIGCFCDSWRAPASDAGTGRPDEADDVGLAVWSALAAKHRTDANLHAITDAVRNILAGAPEPRETQGERIEGEAPYEDATDEELVLAYGRAVVSYQRQHDGAVDWPGSKAIDRLRTTRADLLRALSEGPKRKLIAAGRRIAEEVERARAETERLAEYDAYQNKESNDV